MFRGSLVALVTPFDDDDRIDFAALERLIEFHAREGSDGLVIAGTTGEAATLTRREHEELISRAAEMVAGRMPVLAGTGSNSTAQTIELSRAVGKTGADGYLLVVPYYNKPGQEGIYRHFMAVADAVDKPVVLYNVPGRTVADMQAETVGRLAAHENIVGIKEATGDIGRLEQIVERVEPEFDLLSGDDFTVLPFIQAGGHGVVTVTGNIAPAAMSGLCAAAASGDVESATAFDAMLQPLNEAMFVESNPIPVKWALSQLGMIRPGIRLPLTPLDARHHAQVQTALADAGIAV